MARPKVKAPAQDKPYDASLREQIDRRPGDWARFLGTVAPERVALVDSATKSVVVGPDCVFEIKEAGRPRRMEHMELQASYFKALPERTLKQNVMLRDKYKCPVSSTLVLLRPRARVPAFSGELSYPNPKDPQAPPELVFRYATIRLWERPLVEFLEGGLGTLALAPLADGAQNDLRGVMTRIDARLLAEVPPEERRETWESIGLVLGLRYNAQQIREATKPMSDWVRHSLTYKMLKKEGALEGLQETVLLIGGDRFGPPAPEIVATIERIDDVGRLQELMRKVHKVRSWGRLVADN